MTTKYSCQITREKKEYIFRRFIKVNHDNRQRPFMADDNVMNGTIFIALFLFWLPIINFDLLTQKLMQLDL